MGHGHCVYAKRFNVKITSSTMCFCYVTYYYIEQRASTMWLAIKCIKIIKIIYCKQTLLSMFQVKLKYQSLRDLSEV